MKRFRLKCGTIVTVDECDAYLLRTKVWRGHKGNDGVVSQIVTGHTGAHDPLHRMILPGHEVVGFRNNDATDNRRENLVGMSRADWAKWRRRRPIETA
jgi:hypothetical protein